LLVSAVGQSTNTGFPLSFRGQKISFFSSNKLRRKIFEGIS